MPIPIVLKPHFGRWWRQPMRSGRGRPIAFLILSVLLLGWIFAGYPAIQPTSPEEYLDEAQRQLEQNDPEAAAALARLREERGTEATSVAIESSRQKNPDSGIFDLAEQYRRYGESYQAMLYELSKNPDLLTTSQDRNAFFYSYGTLFQSLIEANVPAEVFENLINNLKTATEDPAIWRSVRDDPIGLIIADLSGYDRDIVSFYAQEREWLGEVVVQLAAAPGDIQADAWGDEPPEITEPQEIALSAIETAKAYHPHVKQAVIEHDFGPFGVMFFDVGGPLLQEAIGRGIPLPELLEVFYLNYDVFSDLIEQFERQNELTSTLQQDVTRQVNYLETVYREREPVWHFARYMPLTLWLDRRTEPEVSTKIFEKYGPDNIPLLLYTQFNGDTGAVAKAAESIAMFGDLAIYVLSEHEDARMAKLLKDPDIGARIVPFILRFGADGFDRAQDDPKWVERYFYEDGTPRDREGIMAWPIVGAPALVMNNWMNGYPNEWSELGWAALDIADGALLVASFGAATPVTAVRQTGSRALRNTVRTSSRLRGQRAGAGTRTQAAEAMRRGTSATPLARARNGVRAGGRLVAAPIAIAGRTVAVAPAAAYRSAVRIRDNWLAVNPSIRKWVYRGLAAAGLYITITERTMPHIREALAGVGDRLGEFGGKVITGTVEVVGRAMLAAIEEITGQSIPAGRTVIFLSGTIILLFLLYIARPTKTQQRKEA